jgi:hypothetical protein
LGKNQKVKKKKIEKKKNLVEKKERKKKSNIKRDQVATFRPFVGPIFFFFGLVGPIIRRDPSFGLVVFFKTQAHFSLQLAFILVHSCLQSYFRLIIGLFWPKLAKIIF